MPGSSSGSDGTGVKVKSGASCPSEEMVGAYLDSRLQRSERANVEQHLDDCASCRGLVAELSRAVPAKRDERPALLAPSVGSRPIRVGDVIAETYQLEEYLGRGACGAVYRARHTRLPREVAIKIISSVLLEKPTALARFENEARIACAMRHENIVEVFDCNRTASGHPYIVMELLEGENLADRIGRRPLDLAVAARIVSQVCDALELLHSRNVVHRDLKPANIFLCSGSQIRAKLLDFGLAKALEEPGVTKTGLLVGTPKYMSPEHIRRQEDTIGPASDVFSMAAIAYECLSNKAAFAGAHLIEVLDRVCHREPVALRLLNPTVPPQVERVLNRALSKKPGERHQSAASFGDAFALACGVPPMRRAGAGSPPPTLSDADSMAKVTRDELLATLPRDSSDRGLPEQMASATKTKPRRSRLAIGMFAALAAATALLAWHLNKPSTNQAPVGTSELEPSHANRVQPTEPRNRSAAGALDASALNANAVDASALNANTVDAGPVDAGTVADATVGADPATSPRKRERSGKERKTIGPLEREID